MDDDDRVMIARLVGEGNQVKQVWEENFPQYTYDEVYWAAYGEGKRSALGTQRMISRRLEDLEHAVKEERRALIKDLGDLVWQQYQIITSNAKKLAAIRKALDR